jgi:hypothetical protein
MKSLNRIVSTPVSALAIVLVGVMLWTGCTAQQFLAEAEKIDTILGAIMPMVAPLVCPFSPVACTAVDAAVSVASPALTALDGWLAKWQAASSAAQPGIYPQLLAAALALQQSQASLLAAAKVNNPAAQSKISAELTALENATTDLITLLQSNKSGTVSGLLEQLNGAEDVTPLWATWNPASSVARVVRGGQTLKLKNGAVIHTHKWYKAQLLDQLSKPSGDARVDAISKALAAKVKRW